MQTKVRRLTRVSLYFLLLIATSVLSFFGTHKKAENLTGFSLIPNTPTAEADVPASPYDGTPYDTESSVDAVDSVDGVDGVDGVDAAADADAGADGDF